MQIRRCRDEKILSDLYNQIASEPGAIYAPLAQDAFSRIFMLENTVYFCAWENSLPVGFCGGLADAGRGVGYLSFIGVLPNWRGRGIGRALLHAIEVELATVPFVGRIETVFHNPVHIPWQIPSGDGADHPCAPGVDTESPLYPLLLREGYEEWTVQNAYYRALDSRAEAPHLAKRRATLLRAGIEITLYDPSVHRGLAELFVGIRNPGWGAYVMSHTDRPIVVAVDRGQENLVVAYTGPLSVEQSGRGNFCGIGTLPAYRGRGIGTLVFCEMCRRHFENGARFMSLYTGQDNPARLIYEAAGFCVVRRFANLRKEVIRL